MSIIFTTFLFFSQFNLELANKEANTFSSIEPPVHDFVTNGNQVSHMDFELVGGLILVEGTVNDQKTQFVLDTGSPHLILNDQSIETDQSKTNSRLNTISGKKKIKNVHHAKFNWLGGKNRKHKKLSTNLSNIERVKKVKIGGLIGYDQVKNYELVIDYEKKDLFLVNNRKRFFENHNQVDKVWFRIVGHIPVVKVKIGKRKFYFGIDTGAEINVINSKIKKRIPKDLIQNEFNSQIVGNDKSDVLVQGLKLESLKVGANEYKNMPFVFANLSYLTSASEFPIDGLLGYPFLKQGQFSINYNKNQLCKWEIKPEVKYSKELMADVSSKK